METPVYTPSAVSRPPGTARRLGKGVWRWLPATLSVVLLMLQVALPWMTEQYATQDGPAHLYNGVALRALLFHPDSPYGAVYTIQPKLVPNWTTTLLFAAAVPVVGAAHAEKLVASLLILLAFLCVAYACRSLSPQASGWTPLTNFLLQTWFLPAGFYNFFFGMALCLLAVGVALRRGPALTLRRALGLAALLVALFFTHLIPTALAVLCILLLAAWDWAATRRGASGLQEALRSAALLALAMLPAVALTLVYIRGASEGAEFHPEFDIAWRHFPLQAFAVSGGRMGRQELLYPVVLGHILIGLFAMTRREWATPRGSLAVATMLAAGLYLVVPNQGLGGSEVKVRFLWAFFLFGGVVASSVRRLLPLRAPLSLLVAALVAGTWWTMLQAQRSVSAALAAYVSVESRLPTGATLVRLRYPTPRVLAGFGVPGDLPFNPYYHADAYLAARRGAVNLSDYEAPSRVFPLVYRDRVSLEHQWLLWTLEEPGEDGSQRLRTLRKELPVAIDYVLVLGERVPGVTDDLGRTLADLEAEGPPLAIAGSPPFLRLYGPLGKGR